MAPPVSSFALVMATGIVSISARLLGVSLVDTALFAINVAAYSVLWLLIVLRLVRQPQALRSELTDHRSGPAVLAIVAATCVLGAQTVLIGGSVVIASALLGLGAVLWLVLLYAVFAALIVGSETPSLPDSVDGGWLLTVVATESIAVLITQLSPHWEPSLRDAAGFVSLSLCLWGALLYVWIVALIAHHYLFAAVSPAELTPMSWITMGAMAIAALAGALLVQDAAVPLLRSLRPALEGFTVLCWATGTAWIPLLVILTLWRVRRVPLRYDVQYWAAVFPLGMYTAATVEMAKALSLGFLDIVPHIFFWVALGAWLATFSGMLRRLAHAGRRRRPGRGEGGGGRFRARSVSGS
jgi:tellurite resistance protein TehA-like permease